MSVNVPNDMGVVVAANFAGRPIFWRDAPTTQAGYPEKFYDAGGFYDGAVRIWGKELGSPSRDIATLGDLHAVSDGSAP